jgi:hypothetical protein
MPALPWKAVSDVPAATPCTILVTRLPLRSFRAVPGFLVWTLRIRRQLAQSPGVIGYALDAHVLRKTFWTVSAWTDAEDMARFSTADPHRAAVRAIRPSMRRPSFVRWTATAAALPVAWAEVRRRAAAQEPRARAGHGSAGG